MTTASRLWTALLLLLLLPGWAAQADEETVTLGVLAFRPKPESQARWQSLANYLNRQLPDKRVQLRTFTYPEMEAALTRNELDFVLTNAAHYIQLRERNRLSGALATLVEQEGDTPLASYGGVIFTRQERHDITRLTDLRGKTLAVVDISALVGYQAQALELAHAGVQLPRAAGRLLTTGQPHDQTVRAVLEGRADAGFARTGVIESMAREGKIDPARLKILNPQNLPSFPYAISTRLYPGWPFVALSHVEESLARRVTAALLLLEHDNPVTRQGRFHGFIIPSDYSPVEELLRELRLPPYEEMPAFTVGDIWHRHYWQIVALLLAVAGILLILLLQGISHRRLTEERQRVKRQAEERLQLLAALGEGVCGLDRRGFITFINPAALTMLGFDAQEVVGRDKHDLFHHHRADGRPYPVEACPIHQSLADSRQRSGEEWFFRRDGSCFPAWFSVSAIREEGSRSEAVLTFRDITERQIWEEQLRRSMELANSASRAKSEFLASMSHEIRTPMNVVIGMSEVLLETALSPEQQNFVRRLQNAGNNLLLLINQILDLSKVEAGMLQLVAEPVQVRPLLEEVASLLRVIATSKGLTLQCGVAPELPEWLNVDGTRLRQVLFNLLGNAVKFTDQGSVALHAFVPVGAAGRFRLTVTDSGIGIGPEHLERIFDSFTQADAGITRRYGGTGLGLTLSRRLVELMDGHIWVESAPGQGSTFHLDLPLQAVEPPALPIPTAGAGRSPLEGPALRILLVEDAEDNQLLIRTFLKGTPHQLTLASDGEQAVRLVQEVDPPFQLVFMDVQMPVMDGYTATRLIRSWERESGRAPLPIVALTAHALEGEAQRSREAGCDLYLTKPIKKLRLLEVIQQLGQEGAIEFIKGWEPS